jgi:hypothetical protein
MSLLSTLSDLLKGCPRNIKRRLLRDILLILFITSGAILAIVLIQGIKSQHDISTSLIIKANKQAGIHFQSFSEPLANTIALLGKWGESGLLKLNDPELLATQFQALMEIQPKINAISLADTDGNDTRLSHYKNQWLLHRHQKSESFSSLWVAGKSINEQLITDDSHNPVTATWFRGALTMNSEKQFFLTYPYSLESTGEKGITASLRWTNKQNQLEKTYISAISFTMKNLMNFMEQLEITENSRILLLQSDATLPGHIRNNNLSTTNSEQFLTAVIEKFKSNPLHTNQAVSIKSNDKTWWLGFSPLSEANDDVWVAIVIPEEDIFEDLYKHWLRFAMIVGAILLTGIIMTIFLVRRYSHQLRDIPQQHINMLGVENEITALIRAGESTTLEFKSTMRTNLRTGKTGKEIEIAWLKTVAAFMNSDGGILLIGVDDTGKVPGIDVDNFANEDKCRLHFKNMINTHIGAEFTRFIHLKIVTIKEKTILIVECERVRRPVFMSIGKQEDFFIRSGPSSIKLSMSQMVKYLGER